MSILIALVSLYFLPTIIRGFMLGLLVVALVAAVNIALASVAHAQQQTRTTCYDSGNTRICDTFDGMGNPISKTRCYKSGKDTRCDTQSINGGAPTTPFIPQR
jgi:hypothetical protein